MPRLRIVVQDDALGWTLGRTSVNVEGAVQEKTSKRWICDDEDLAHTEPSFLLLTSARLTGQNAGHKNLILLANLEHALRIRVADAEQQ